jgi:hypothetical protein
VRRVAVAPGAARVELCTQQIALALEDDAPLVGNRATFLVDVQNLRWIARVRSTRARHFARVGQVPFNFQISRR